MDPFRSSLASFETRGLYLDFIRGLSSCDNYASVSDNPYYGKVNSNGDIVYLSEKFLAPLPTKEKKAVYALNFVVDASVILKATILRRLTQALSRMMSYEKLSTLSRDGIVSTKCTPTILIVFIIPWLIPICNEGIEPNKRFQATLMNLWTH